MDSLLTGGTRGRLPKFSPFPEKLDQDPKTPQTATEQHANGGTQEGGESDRFDLLPGNQPTKEVGRDPAGPEPENSTEQKSHEGASGDDRKDVFPAHARDSG